MSFLLDEPVSVGILDAQATITTYQASQLLGVCEETVRRAIKKGEIASVKLGTRRLVLTRQLKKWLRC